MRVTLITFVLSSLFCVAGCGGSSSGDEGESGPIVGAGAETDSPNPGTGGDASSVDNSSVKDKPLMKSCYKADSFACQVEATIVAETNKIRGSLSPLAHDFESSFVARKWSNDQAVSGIISHDGFPYERKKVLVSEFPNASWGFFAENVAMVSNREEDPVKVGKAFAEMWKNSSGHYKNMMGNYKFLGVGVFKSGNSVYATQIFH